MNPRLLLFACGLLLAATVTHAAPTTLPTTEPDLTTAAAIRELSPEQAAQHLPVRITGVVTYIANLPQLMFVQDDTGGICVSGPRERDARPLRLGSRVEVQGVTAPGLLVPVVVGRAKDPVKLTIVAEGARLPTPKSVTLAQLASRDNQGDLVEVQGIVRSVTNQTTASVAAEALVVTLASGTDRLEAAFLVWHGGKGLPSNLVGATVRIRGVFNTALPEKQQAAANRLLSPAMKDLKVILPAAPPFELPVISIPTLKTLPADEPLPGRTRIAGIVTLTVPHKGIFIQADDSGVWVEAPQSDLVVGDRAQVVGFPARRGNTIALEDVIWKNDAHPGLPDAPTITPEQALRTDFDARLVRMEALVLEVSRLTEGTTLVLQSGERVFLARVADFPATGAFEAPRQESWVRLTGVCVHNRLPSAQSPASAPSDHPLSFHILLNSPASIDVIRAPSWWTLGRILAACSLLAVVALTAFAWVALLRVRVARQTSLIRDHVARETLYEERVRIARELHDSLEQDLLGISMQLNATDKLLTHPDRARESLLLASAMVRRSQSETHRAVWDLRDPHASSDGLVTVLRDAVAALDPVTAASIEVTVQGEPRELPAPTQNHLLRVALEAVTNALKHAAPKRIDIDLAFEDHRLTLRVRDDGRGFDPQRLPPLSSGHFGLFGMRERADKLQGELTILSTPGQGAQIQLTVPLPE